MLALPAVWRYRHGKRTGNPVSWTGGGLLVLGFAGSWGGSAVQEGWAGYDDHDDGLHLRALGDPGRYARRMRNGQSAFATAVVLD